MKPSLLFLLPLFLCLIQDSCYARKHRKEKKEKKQNNCINSASKEFYGRCVFLFDYVEQILNNRCGNRNGRPIIINSQDEAEAFLQFARDFHGPYAYQVRPKGYWVALSIGNEYVIENDGRLAIPPEAPFNRKPQGYQCNMLMVKSVKIESTRCRTSVPIFCEEVPPQEEEEEVIEENDGTDGMTEEECCSCCDSEL